MTFKELQVGDIFDFINDEQQSLTSFWSQCRKISPRMYESTETHQCYRVGSVQATVFHVKTSRDAITNALKSLRWAAQLLDIAEDRNCEFNDSIAGLEELLHATDKKEAR